MNPILRHNQHAWDLRVQRGQDHTHPATDKVFRDPAEMADIHGWIGRRLHSKNVLCLGAGGGRHGPVYAAAGAIVTVADLSAAMLELDRGVARERGLTLRTVHASMEDMPALSDGEFQLVVQPVSTCYVPDIRAVYREVARVTAPGGLYISQHKQPVNLQSHAVPERGSYGVPEPYYRTGPLPPAPENCAHREFGCLEFLHRWEDLLGGLCQSGFVIEDLLEPNHADLRAQPGSFGHRSAFIPPYVTVKARRLDAPGVTTPRLWLP